MLLASCGGDDEGGDEKRSAKGSQVVRSPLTGLKSAAQLMQARRDSLDARSARNLDLLIGQVGRFERLVQDLLEISRFDAGVATLDAEPTDKRPVTAETVATAFDTAGHADHMHVRFQCDPGNRRCRSRGR